MLTPSQIDAFLNEGFLRIPEAFPKTLAAQARDILWRDTGCHPHNPATWTRPVIRLGFYTQPPFVQAANTPLLHQAFDQLVGPGRWLPPAGLGTFPIRFPSANPPGDDGWHIDTSFNTEDPNFLNWRANIHSKGRALLMLFLFSDIGDHDAPTRIRIGSHLAIARQLAPAADAGLTLGQLAANGFHETTHLPETQATGEAGTVYLCHPFLVHAAQPHRGTAPRFLAQPPLLPAQPLQLHRPNADYSPVERAIRNATAAAP